jgi:hypothetical protein
VTPALEAIRTTVAGLPLRERQWVLSRIGADLRAMFDAQHEVARKEHDRQVARDQRLHPKTPHRNIYAGEAPVRRARRAAGDAAVQLSLEDVA